MSRSGYRDTDDMADNWQFIRWSGAVKSAIRGKRGQAFLKEMLAALDVLPEKRLIHGVLQDSYDTNAVCALGAVGRARGLDMTKINMELDDYGEYEDDVVFDIQGMFNLSDALTREIMYENDEGKSQETPEERFDRIRRWVVRNIKEDTSK